MKGFYKYDGELQFAPHFVLNKDYELKIENKDNYNYPVDGWVYFETQGQAEEYFKIGISDEKQVDIFKYKLIEKEATEKRSEYITAELLPDGKFKTMKLEKLEADRVDIENRFNTSINNLITKYGEDILNDII